MSQAYPLTKEQLRQIESGLSFAPMPNFVKWLYSEKLKRSKIVGWISNRKKVNELQIEVQRLKNWVEKNQFELELYKSFNKLPSHELSYGGDCKDHYAREGFKLHDIIDSQYHGKAISVYVKAKKPSKPSTKSKRKR